MTWNDETWSITWVMTTRQDKINYDLQLRPTNGRVVGANIPNSGEPGCENMLITHLHNNCLISFPGKELEVRLGHVTKTPKLRTYEQVSHDPTYIRIWFSWFFFICFSFFFFFKHFTSDASKMSRGPLSGSRRPTFYNKMMDIWYSWRKV